MTQACATLFGSFGWFFSRVACRWIGINEYRRALCSSGSSLCRKWVVNALREATVAVVVDLDSDVRL